MKARKGIRGLVWSMPGWEMEIGGKFFIVCGERNLGMTAEKRGPP